MSPAKSGSTVSRATSPSPVQREPESERLGKIGFQDAVEAGLITRPEGPYSAPFRFVVWLPVRGGVVVPSEAFADLFGGDNARVYSALVAGDLAWSNSNGDAVAHRWWQLFSSVLSTDPGWAYRARMSGW